MSRISIGGDAARGTPADTHPVFVQTIAASLNRSASGVASAGSLSQSGAAIADLLLRPRPLALLLGGSLACAALFCLSMFDLRFLIGTSPYWQAPRALVEGGWGDISTAFSGYTYFVKDAWTLPLFQTSKLGVPNPVNIIFTDSIPIVALIGRLVYRFSCEAVNPYGAWTALCFVCSAVSMTGLVAVLGQRGLAAAFMATVCGLCMPALLARWGHLALMGQWQIPLACIIYVRSRSAARATGLIVSSLVLAILALWTNAYLFAMVTAILATTLAQAASDRRLRLLHAGAVALTVLTVLVGLMLISGYFSNPGSLGDAGFGYYSMNVASPFAIQASGLVPARRDVILDATGGQYEGFSYLGGGVLLLLTAMLARGQRLVLTVWPNHACMIVLLLACTLFAISNDIWIGSWHVLTIPLPKPMLMRASVFRSSGRFFWVCLYLLTATIIVAAPLLWGRAGAALLVVAAVVQFVDTGPLRSALAARTSAPAVAELDDAAWNAAIRQHALVSVFPPYDCLSPETEPAALRIAVELQLAAARENVAINTVYAARHTPDCTFPDAVPLGSDELRVYLLSPSRARPAPDLAHCAASSALMACSLQLRPSELAALLAAPPQEQKAKVPARQ